MPPSKPQHKQLLGPGTKAESGVKSDILINMLWRGGSAETRLGFGQVTQWDTTLGNPTTIADQTAEWGLQEHLGSRMLRTAFGHEQVFSLFKAYVRLSEFSSASIVSTCYLAHIYDLSTKSHWEELLTVTTSEYDARAYPMPNMHGHYQSTGAHQFPGPRSVVDGDQAFFVEHAGRLFFGNSDLGLMCYLPAIFPKDRTGLAFKRMSAANTTQFLHDWQDNREESALIVRVIGAPGPGSSGLPSDNGLYLTEGDFPKPCAVAMWNNRLIYADHDRKTVWFSDVNWPGSVHVDNYLIIPSTKPITAMEELAGDIYIWTAEETYVYRPSDGMIASGGRGPVRIHDRIGCVGPAAVVKDFDGLVWCDRNGVHATNGGMNVETISGDIDEVFANYVTNPLTSYYASTTDPDPPTSNYQPTSRIAFDEQGLNLCYHADIRALLVSIPKYNAILCRSEGKWSIWSVESQAHTSVGLKDTYASVGAVRNIINPWLLSNGKDLHLVGGPDEQLIRNDLGEGPEHHTNHTSWSYYLLKYGRGGSIDRSVWDEDDRYHKQWWSYQDTSQEDLVLGGIYIGKPIWLPPGYLFPNATKLWATRPGALVPIYIVPSQDMTAANGLSAFDIRFTFDGDEWVPAFHTPPAAGPEIDFLLPPERWFSRGGYAPGAMAVGTQVRAYTLDGPAPGAGALDPTGHCLVMQWTGAAGAAWTQQPDMNLNARHLNPIIYVPFKKVNDDPDLNGMGIEGIRADVTIGGAAIEFDFATWGETTLGEDKSHDDSVAQAIDWAVRCRPFGHPEQLTLLRDLWVQISTHGTGTDSVVPIAAWPYKVLNAVFSTDFKAWVSQIVDHSMGYDPAVQITINKSGMRSRVWVSGAMVEKKWRQSGLVWGSSAAIGVGNVLIGDVPTQRVNFAEAIEGGEIEVMLFGHLTDRAEHLRIDDIQAEYVNYGRRIRIGTPEARGSSDFTVTLP